MPARSMIGLLLLLVACSSTPRTERVTVPPGATFSQVIDTLAGHGLVGWRPWFKLVARLRRLDRNVKAGVYEFSPGSGTWGVLSTLQSGRVAVVRLTVPEGLTILEVADLAAARLGFPRESLISAARDSAEAAALGVQRPTLEGFLLPETYQLPLGATAREVVHAMTLEFKHAWNPAWDARLDSMQLTRVQLLALASIVEGEARHDEERPIIAGVYVNRLRIGMPLQADPTVQYAIQLKTGERKPRLYYKDYAIPSPYNTYLNPGLPPGPVNSPGIKSIRAAIFPATVPFLYFVAEPDGHHLFSRTLAEHDAATGLLRRAERKAAAKNGKP
ncbi:MAG: endolytic transglycosylase MltG [Gemmatimonadota bacterium]